MMINLLNALNAGLTPDKKFPGLYTEGSNKVQYRYSQNGKYHNSSGAAIVDRRNETISYFFYLNGTNFTTTIKDLIKNGIISPSYDSEGDIFFNETDKFTINLLCN